VAWWNALALGIYSILIKYVLIASEKVHIIQNNQQWLERSWLN